MRTTIIIISPMDNVAVALEDLTEGSDALTASGEAFTAAEKIPYSHKMAIRDIAHGEPIVKYGEIIGEASTDIKKGSWVHTHNLAGEGLKP